MAARALSRSAPDSSSCANAGTAAKMHRRVAGQSDFMKHLILPAIVLLFQTFASAAAAQEGRPYFVTYDHYLEERGELEVSLSATSGVPKDGDSRYHAPWFEFEYGVSDRWTTELYLEGTVIRDDGSAFTGWRWENRFRPLKGDRLFNPVLYVEYEQINEASRIQKEIVGSGRLNFAPISELRHTPARELEAKLILSSTFGGWNVAENFTAEKNLSEEEGVEFGYSVGVSRAHRRLAVGVEAYGGLGSTLGFDAHEQRHYLAPVLSWHIAPGTLKVSVAAGLTSASDHALFRVSYSLEFHPGP